MDDDDKNLLLKHRQDSIGRHRNPVGMRDSEVAHALGGRSNPTKASLVLHTVSNFVVQEQASDNIDDGNDGREISIISPHGNQVQLSRSQLASSRAMMMRTK